MSKRKRKRRRRSPRPSPRQRQALEAAFERADRLIAQEHPQQAIELLERYLETHPREPELHYTLGYAHAQAGSLWKGLAGYERAIELGDDPSVRVPLGALYLEAELPAHALRTWRPALERADANPMIAQMRRTLKELEQGTIDMAQDLGIELQEAEEGRYQMEVGRRALAERDYPAAIAASRRAIRRLGDWPPPHNNLAMALFYDGQPEQAIAICRQVIERDADNIHALSNAIRFLAWTGRGAEARSLWDRLRTVTPGLPSERLKIVEAAADLDEDEYVYRALNPSGGPPLSQEMHPRHRPAIEVKLALAEANTGRRREAIRRLESLQSQAPRVEIYLDALRAGKPGPGWADRFSYVSYRDLVPEHEMEAFVNLAVRREDVQEPCFRHRVERFVSRYPQIVRVAELIIWEAELPDLGIPTLAAVATSAAHDALRRFALSQAGEDDVRMRALSALAESGGLGPDEWVQMWLDGAWQTVRMREYDLVEELGPAYTDQVADVLNRGLVAMQEGDDEQAERLYRQALELEPRARQAYNNLGAIYLDRGEREQAREMFEAALQVDPTYAYPRCTLANELIDEGDIAGAEEMLRPLQDVTQLQPVEMSFYAYTQARILVSRRKYDQARRSLRAALQFTPDYEPAKELLEWIKVIGPLQSSFGSLVEEMRKRNSAKRSRLQAKLTTPDPTLAQALPLYTKDALTDVARVVLPSGGWSALRKAELIDEIVAGLWDANNLSRIVDELGQEDRAALREVLDAGGSLPWAQFDAAYGNDLDGAVYGSFARGKTPMGRLRGGGLLVEATVDGELRVAIPADLRAQLDQVL